MGENRFKESVDTATDNTIENILKDTKENMKDDIKTNTKEIIKEIATDNIKVNIGNNMGNNILKKISEIEKKDKGSNHTIYLSAEVGVELKKIMKKTDKSKSTLIDEILKAVFFDN